MSTVAAPRFPSAVRLVARQARYQVITIWRIPVAFFFTLALPLIMLVLFNALFGDDVVDTPDGSWSVSQFYTGGLAAFTAVSATYTNLANMVPLRRDEGVLKRWRGTPLPTWTYMTGFIVSAVLIALAGVLAMITVGYVAYDLEIDWAKMPAAALTFVVGVSTFAALGLALAAVVRSASSASAAANATLLPLAFVSNIFIPLGDDAPTWLETIGDIFPLKPFAEAFQDCFNPLVEAPAFAWGDLAYVALWGVAGAIVAVTRFRWEPSGTAPRGRRAARVAATGDGTDATASVS
jgi:ABC-2 type transport system permease protein